MTTVERLFAATYLELASLAEDESAGAFYLTSDYGKLESLGPSLPSLKVTLPRATGSTSAVKVQLDIKLIKPPFKFNVSLSSNGNTTISRVKQDLISAVDLLASAGVTGSDVKLLVKGKVILDTALVATLGEGKVLVMAMVSVHKQDASSLKQPDSVESIGSSDPSDPSEPTEPFRISSATWAKIEKILVEDLGVERGDKELRRLQGI